MFNPCLTTIELLISTTIYLSNTFVIIVMKYSHTHNLKYYLITKLLHNTAYRYFFWVI